MANVFSRPGQATGPAFYDDDGLDYHDYWSGRNYEHRAEVMAIRRLLDGHSFRDAVDVGGGYGRLSVVLADYAHRVTLVDPSRKQIDRAERFLADHPEIDRQLMEAGKLRFASESFDLAVMIRVLHHLPEPAREFGELHRILRPGGYALIEVANSTHAMNRIRYFARHRQIPLSAIDLLPSLPVHQPAGGIPFVNHHPLTIVSQLRAAGLAVERSLSVSNLRHPVLKKTLPLRSMLLAERLLQERLARVAFGPSVFLLLRKPRGARQRGSTL